MWYFVTPEIALDIPAQAAIVRTVRLPDPKPVPRVKPVEGSPASGNWIPRGYIPWTCTASPTHINRTHASGPSSPAIPSGGAPAPGTTWKNLPAIFWQNIKLPKSHAYSEKGALKYIAHKLHAELLFAGPDYALVGAGVPFNKPVPAVVLLRDIATIPYIRGEVVVHSATPRFVTVRNAPLEE